MSSCWPADNHRRLGGHWEVLITLLPGAWSGTRPVQLSYRDANVLTCLQQNLVAWVPADVTPLVAAVPALVLPLKALGVHKYGTTDQDRLPHDSCIMVSYQQCAWPRACVIPASQRQRPAAARS
jgi:hypothetical protein